MRIHVYRMENTPAIGAGSSDEELGRLERVVGELVLVELGDEPEPPPPEFRAHDHATATAADNKQYLENVKKTIKAYRALIALTKEGIFRLPVEEEEEEQQEGGGGSGGSGGGKRRKKSSSSSSSSSAARRRGPRRIKKAECELIGQSFEEDGTNWKVLDVSWSEEIKPAQVVVYYYDHDLATSEGIDETDLLESLQESSDHTDIEHIEYSSVKEVIDWLRACKDGE